MKKPKNQEESTFIDSPNYFSEDFGGNLTAAQIKSVKAILRKFMRKMRALLGRSMNRLKKVKCHNVGHPCKTCAFSPQTDEWSGFIGTTYGLVWAINNNKLFLCHHNQEHWEKNQIDLRKLEICKGFRHVVTVNGNVAKVLALKAKQDIRAIIKNKWTATELCNSEPKKIASESIEYVTYQEQRFRVLERLDGRRLVLRIGFRNGQLNTRTVNESEVETTNVAGETGNITTIGFFHRRKR